MEETVARIIGDDHYEKVSLPGESLWVKVVEKPTMGTMAGRIANVPVSTLHKIKHGDVVQFGWVVREINGTAYGAWEPE